MTKLSLGGVEIELPQMRFIKPYDWETDQSTKVVHIGLEEKEETLKILIKTSDGLLHTLDLLKAKPTYTPAKLFVEPLCQNCGASPMDVTLENGKNICLKCGHERK